MEAGEPLVEATCAPAPVISYEAAKIFFRGEQRLRSIEMIWPVLLCATFAAAGVGLMFRGWRSRGEQIVSIAFLAFGLLVGGFFLLGMLLDWRHPLEIRSDGILWGRKLKPWASIAKVGAYGRSDGERVELFYSTKLGSATMRSAIGPAARMDRSSYEMLMEQLRAEVGPHHPHLMLETTYEQQRD